MALADCPSLDLDNDLRALARDLDAADYGQSGTLVEDFMRRYGWTDANRVYRGLKRIGWSSGRKRRTDAGTTSVPDATIDAIGAALRLGLRENGKQTMDVPNAISLLAQNGFDIPVGTARVNTLLRQRHLSTAAARQAKNSIVTRAPHPNYEHQVDPSLCLLYYTPNGQQHVLHDDEIYKNKPEWIEKVGNLKCWRYVLYDRYSGTLIVRYYQAKGETQANLYDFLLYAWRKTEGRVFHGVSVILIWDLGSANSATAIKNALRALDVDPIPHAKGNAQAKGGVENGNNLVEKGFESRLRYEPVRNIDELNAAVERWYNAFNANAIPRLDTRLRRPGMDPMARYHLWQRIRTEHLRLLPDDDTCRYLLSAEPETRTIRATPAGGLSIQYAHPILKRTGYYDLSRLPGVVRDLKVKVSPLFYGEPGRVLVTIADYKGDETHHALAPVAWDEAGQRLDAPVKGERYRANPDTPAETAAKRADATAFPGMDQDQIKKAKAKGAAPFGGLDAHSHLANVYQPAYLNRPGTAMEVRNPVAVQARVLNPTELCAEMIRRLGRAWDPDMGPAIFGAYPDGAPDTELPALADWLRGGAWNAPIPAGRPKLVAL